MAGKDFPGDNMLSFGGGRTKKKLRTDSYTLSWCTASLFHLLWPKPDILIKNTTYAIKCVVPPPVPRHYSSRRYKQMNALQMYMETAAYWVKTSGFPNSSPWVPPCQNVLCKQTVPSVIFTVYGTCTHRRRRAMGRARERETYHHLNLWADPVILQITSVINKVLWPHIGLYSAPPPPLSD